MSRRAQLDGSATVLNRSNTPLLQNPWFVGPARGSSGDMSGRATPVQVDASLDQETVDSFAMALDRFKSNWDNGMAVQPHPHSTSPRRDGFSRDGIHFYLSANCILKNTKTVDLQVLADQQFTRASCISKSVKAWAMSDSSRGEEMGSVGEIDAQYGATGLILDMSQLLGPLTLPTLIKSEGATDALATMGRTHSGSMM